MPEVSVAIPVRDGGGALADVLDALASQTVEHELLICDSGSSDRSPALARARGARVLEIEARRFNHGATRNLLVDAAAGTHVALLTQDSRPADERWLERILRGFELADDVAIVYGPYLPRADAPAPVRLELERWFRSLSPDGSPQLERLREDERSPSGDDALPVLELVGRRGFFTDANACLARAAWEHVPFREAAYAEDRVLALDMLRAGYAKSFVPQAAVIHSHSYTPRQQLGRAFDEGRALREVYGWREPASPRHLLSQLRGEIGHARTQLLAEGVTSGRRRATLAAVARHHALSRAGALLGSRSDTLPAALARRLSLEARAGFTPLDLDRTPQTPPPDPSI
jgi:GT2 family glycosyltransferase